MRLGGLFSHQSSGLGLGWVYAYDATAQPEIVTYQSPAARNFI
jgi:hypothetical protein